MDESWIYYAKKPVKEDCHTRPHIAWFHLHEMFSIDKSIETKSKLMID